MWKLLERKLTELLVGVYRGVKRAITDDVGLTEPEPQTIETTGQRIEENGKGRKRLASK